MAEKILLPRDLIHRIAKIAKARSIAPFAALQLVLEAGVEAIEAGPIPIGRTSLGAPDERRETKPAIPFHRDPTWISTPPDQRR